VSFSGRDSLTFTLIRAIIETGIDRFLLRYNFCDDKFSLHDLPLLFPCAKLFPRQIQDNNLFQVQAFPIKFNCS
jgi:hypothetical protein